MVYEPQFQSMTEKIRHLSHAQALEIMAILAQQLQKTAPISQSTSLLDFAGIAPNLLEGQDAQTWVTEIRGKEWERDFH